MFKKENRLAPGIGFGNSHLYIASQFILKEKENGLGLNRFGIVASKKIANKAVCRNKIKRFLRTSLANFNKKMDQGHDILLIVKKAVLDKTKEENLLTIKKTLAKAGLIQE